MKSRTRSRIATVAATFVVAITLALTTNFDQPLAAVPSSDNAAVILDLQAIGESTAIVFTESSVFRTDDKGSTWRKLPLDAGVTETISSVVFRSESEGFVLISSPRGVTIGRTNDGGETWERLHADLPQLAEIDAVPSTAKLRLEHNAISIELMITTSSNFKGTAVYRSEDGGNNWSLTDREVVNNVAEDPEAVKTVGEWKISTEGKCLGFKTGCFIESKITVARTDLTPPQIKAAAEQLRSAASAEAQPMFTAPPGGATRISLNRGFDKCQAGSVAQMQTWWDTSWFHDTNIYMSGRARSCPTQPFTNNPAWIDAVSAQGWGLIPTIVGYQAPCSVSSTPHKFSSVPATAEQQGRGEADIAVADAISIGLTAGSVLYYDMERYNDPGDGTCSAAAIAFLKGWTERTHELGYVSGVYGSPSNAVPDWWPMPASSRMDAIWMARWDNVMSVWVYNSPSPAFPVGAWENHQRIKQWQAPHNETWGGITFNIDGNISDGPVAGIAVPKNKNADFDGDGKSDISVFRPDTGVWYVLNSTNGNFSAVGFGLSTDTISPGDYDGDGKTDRAVFRSSDGVWHILMKGFNYTARQFGSAGDLPVAGDYNGDGKTDIAIWRPSTGVWYIANSDSRNTYTIVQFGLTGDKPVPADFDGDGKTDIAVYRPSDGVWHMLRSSDGGYWAVGFGLSADLPTQGDYDGDGKADPAVYRDGTWYVLQSTAGFTAFNFGLPGDVPSTGDFDGDAKADAAVFRPSNGVWYLLQSTNGFYAAQFGIATDRSVPNAYLPQN